MTWAWVGVAWMVVLFVLACIVFVFLFGLLWILVHYTVKSIKEGLRESREECDDRAALASAPSRVAKVTPILRNPE